MTRLEMKNCNKILTEKLLRYQPYHHEKNLTGEEILPSNQQQIIEKAFEKQIKTIEDQGEKQIQNQG